MTSMNIFSNLCCNILGLWIPECWVPFSPTWTVDPSYVYSILATLLQELWRFSALWLMAQQHFGIPTVRSGPAMVVVFIINIFFIHYIWQLRIQKIVFLMANQCRGTIGKFQIQKILFFTVHFRFMGNNSLWKITDSEEFIPNCELRIRIDYSWWQFQTQRNYSFGEFQCQRWLFWMSFLLAISSNCNFVQFYMTLIYLLACKFKFIKIFVVLSSHCTHANVML